MDYSIVSIKLNEAVCVQKDDFPHWVEGSSEIHSDLAHIHPVAADFVTQMLVEDPTQRQTARQLLRHPFLEPVLPLRHLDIPLPLPPIQSAAPAAQVKLYILFLLILI